MKTNRWEFNNQPKIGTILHVSDDVVGYWTAIAQGEDWKAVMRTFANGYDHGDTDGGGRGKRKTAGGRRGKSLRRNAVRHR